MKLPMLKHSRNIGKAEGVNQQNILVDDPGYLVDDPVALAGSLVDTTTSAQTIRPVTIRPKMTK